MAKQKHNQIYSYTNTAYIYANAVETQRTRPEE